MVSFKKAMALKTPEEVGKLSPKERKEYESQIQQEYKIKVHTLSVCCKKFGSAKREDLNKGRKRKRRFKRRVKKFS